MVFQSTLPAKGATGRKKKMLICVMISIHAPREGSDMDYKRFSICTNSISIHAPREGSDWCVQLK